MFDIEDIKNPDFIKTLDDTQVNELSYDIRTFMIESISKTGGYLLQNLSSVELEIAMHYVFNAPFDKFLFDCMGMGYTHKILTGRAKQFKLLRHQDGISSNIKDNESDYDCVSINHSGNALGIASGMSFARALKAENNEIVVVINSDSLNQGSSLEALYRIGLNSKKIIIILNDISDESDDLKFVSKFINNIRNSKEYLHLKKDMKNILSKNELAKNFANKVVNIKDNIKGKIIHGGICDLYDINYLGPINGHDFNELVKAFNKAKIEEGPVLIHVKTIAGKGYLKYENDEKIKTSFCDSFNLDTGKELANTPKGYYRFEDLVASKIDRLMSLNDNIICISTSNIDESGFKGVMAKYPKRVIDANGLFDYAIEVACGLAKNGFHPIVEIDSSHYRKAHDQLHDLIFSNNLAITILISKTGLLQGEDFVNQGIYDGIINNREDIIVCEGKDGDEIKDLLYSSLNSNKAYIVRYPKGCLTYQRSDFHNIEIGSWMILNDIKDYKVSIISYGNDVSLVYKEVVINELAYQVINARFINPIDKALLLKLFSDNKPIVIYQNDYINGGLADNIIRFANEMHATNIIKVIAIHDKDIGIGTISQMKKRLKLDINSLFEEIKELC